MPRPVKKGLDYFPLNVDLFNDYKIMDLLEKHGPLGVTVYEVVLCEVYRNGYYLAAPIDRVSANVARIIGSKWAQKRLVTQVILDCGDLGLFETTLLKHGVITSVGIQRRYATVTARNKTKKEEYWLIDEDGQPLLNTPQNQVSVSEMQVSATETEVSVPVIPQKESKENETKQNKKICPEPCESSEPDAVYKLVLIDGSTYPVTAKKIERYRELYPAVDVDQEYRKMIGWIDTHPKNRKTRNGIEKFVNGWLSRAQDSARPEPAGKAPKKNQFQNFPQRETDYDAIVMQQLQGGTHGSDK